MVKWKEAFDEYTRMPKSPPLPSGLFVTYQSSQQTTPFTSTLEDSLRICDLQPQHAYHVNPTSGEGIQASFAHFITRVLEDQEDNRRNEGDLVDDIWDESIRAK